MSSTTIGASTAPSPGQVASPPPRVPHVPGSAPAGDPAMRVAAPDPKPAETKQAAPKADDVKNAMERITDFVKYTASDIQFTVDKDTNSLVVKVIDRNSKEVLRQIPSEEVLQIAKTLDSLQGLFVRQKA